VSETEIVSSEGPAGVNRASRSAAVWAFFVVSGAVFALGLTFDRLYDTDSYLHMALARHLAAEGPTAGIPWARFSILAEGFGDKEILFHAFLIPFVKLFAVVPGGMLAVALLIGAIASLLVSLAERFSNVGRWVPILVLLGSLDAANRLLRVRPELLALILFLVGIDAAARRRYRLLALISFLFPLSHVSVLAYVGLFAILFGALLLRDGKPEWPLLWVPLAAAAVALLAHPQFPANVNFVRAAAFDVIALRRELDSGLELHPPSLDGILACNIGWLAAMVVLWRARRPAPPASEEAGRSALFFGLAAIVFGFLNVAMGRFVVFIVSFGTIALLAALRARGEEVGPLVALPFRGTLPTRLALTLAVMLELPAFPWAVSGLSAAEVFRKAPDREWDQVRPLIPLGSRVAAQWGSAEVYSWAFPQGRYLNLFDPALMAIPFPGTYRLQRAVWDGTEPDPVFASFVQLDSDYILYHRNLDRLPLEARLARDPRLTVLHKREEMLVRIEPARTEPFFLDWRFLPVPSPLEVPDEGAWSRAPSWPRARTRRGRAVEAYVDASRLQPGKAACLAFRHDLEVGEADRAETMLEFSPWGPSALLVDGRLLAFVPGGTRAILGKGIHFPVSLSIGKHRIVAISCQEENRNGFYLLRR
jgi:hypothetical protein